MSRSPCKRMIRRLARELSRERDNFAAMPSASREGEYWVDDEGNILPPGNMWQPKEPLKWAN